jgi:hypothetical protein
LGRWPEPKTNWHSACVAAWNFWARQASAAAASAGAACRESGKRLLKTAEVDHRMPLFQVFKEHRDLPWPQLLSYWGLPNLQLINREAHAAKCAAEAGYRSQKRTDTVAA